MLRARRPLPGERRRLRGDVRRAAAALAPLLPLALAAIVYFPLIRTYFLTDDFLNLYRIANADLLDYLLTPHGGHLLLTRNALFYSFFQVFAARAELFFAVVLATHLLNVGLLFGVLRRWTDSAALATFGATAWGICPIHAGTLGWYSVYGQAVVGTILLVLLRQISIALRDGAALPRSAVWTWPLLLLAASTSFGVGIGITAAMPFAVFLLLPRSPSRTRLCVVLGAVAVAVPLLYRGMLALSSHLYGMSAEVWTAEMAYAYAARELPVGRAALMIAQMLGNAILRPLLGFAFNPRVLPAPILYAALVLFLVLVTVALRRAPGHLRRQVFALLLLALASYAIIAVGRAAFFEPALMPRAAAPPRYHYVGPIPLIVILCLALARMAARRRPTALVTGPLLALWLLVAAVSFARAPSFIISHVAARRETDRIRAAVAAAVAAAPPGADVYIDNQPFRAIGPLLVGTAERFPGWAAAFTFLFPSNVVDGHRVRFVDDDPAARKGARTGKRTHDLLVSPAEAGRAQPQRPAAAPRS